jgi:hypothetical protein
MKAMYHKETLHPLSKKESDIICQGGEDAILPPKAGPTSLGHTLAHKRRGRIYTPQASRPDTLAETYEISRSLFKSTLKQPKTPIVAKGEVDLRNDGEVSPQDISRPLYRNELTLPSPEIPDAIPPQWFCDAAAPPTLISPKPIPRSTSLKLDSSITTLPLTEPLIEQPILPGLKENNPISTPVLHLPHTPPSPTPPTIEPLPISQYHTKSVSSTPTLTTQPKPTKGANFPRIDYGPVGKYTALHSHPISEEEREFSIWLGEGWRAWRGQKGDGGRGVGGRGLKRGVRGFWCGL